MATQGVWGGGWRRVKEKAVTCVQSQNNRFGSHLYNVVELDSTLGALFVSIYLHHFVKQNDFDKENIT